MNSEFKVLTNGIMAIPDGLSKVIQSPFWSTIGSAITSCVAFLFGAAPVGYAFAGLLLADGLTGWAKARKNGEKPSSSTLGEKTFAKLMVYIIPLLGWTLLEMMFEGAGIIAAGALHPVHIIIIGWIGAREFISILENLDTMYGEEYKIIRILYNRVKGIEENLTGQLTNNKTK